MANIMLIEDDPLVRQMLQDVLGRNGYHVREAENGPSALRMIQADAPDLILLDVMLDQTMSGLDVCRELRRSPNTEGLPIIALTGSTAPRAEALLFEAGVDDFIRKDEMQPDVLLHRIRACLRRQSSAQSDVLQVGPLELHLVLRQAFVGGTPVTLRPKEFEVLALMAQRADETVSRDELMGREADDDRQTAVNVHILKIRRALGAVGWMVETVRGEGYRLRSSSPTGTSA